MSDSDASDSRCEFVATLVLVIHHAGHSWIHNTFAGLLVHLVKLLVESDQRKTNTSQLEYEYMKMLCYRIPVLCASSFSELWKPRSDDILWAPNAQYGHTLLALIYAGRISVVSSMIQDSSVEVTAVYSELLGTPLYAAVQGGHRDLAFELLERGADPDKSTAWAYLRQRSAPLCTAVMNKDEYLVRLIMEPKYRCHFAERSILFAFATNQPKITSFLLERLRRPLSRARRVLGFGIFQAARYGMTEIAELLLDNGAPPGSVRPPGRSSPVDNAAWAGHESLLRLLLDRGASPYGCGSIEQGDPTPSISSMCAVMWSGNIGTFQILLDAGLSFESFTSDDWLHILQIAAYSSESIPLVRTLLEDGLLSLTKMGPDPTQSMVAACRVLLSACEHGRVDLVKVLVKHGVTLDTTFYLEHNLSTPWVEATAYRQNGLASILLELGATEYDPLRTSYRDKFLSGDFPCDPRPVLCAMPFSPTEHKTPAVKKLRKEFVSL